MAERVLVPGDPARAMRLANALTDKPLMLNHARGLWGYSGTAADGELLTVQATGLGGPSAAAVVADLVALGARRVIRVGTCAALSGGPSVGAVVGVDSVITEDGTSRALGFTGEIAPAIVVDLPSVTVVSTDLPSVGLFAGAHVRDMTTAAVLAAAAAAGISAGAVLVVVGEGLDEEALHAAELAAGRAALAALVA